MAWLYLVIVTLVFYIPIVGLGPRLIEEDFTIQISALSLTIPFSSSLRLLLYSALAWFVLWRGTLLLEQIAGIDLLSWLGLPRRWMYAVRPRLSNQLARYLAKIALVICLVKVIGLILLGLALAIALPWAIEYLMAQVPGAAWIELLAKWLQDVLMGLIRDWLSALVNFEVPATLMSLSILVLTANRAHGWEREYRCQLDLERNRRRRKQEQADIIVPSTQE